MRIVPGTPEGIAEAAALLLDGQPVGMPTETVYGLAGVVWDEGSVEAIFRIKGRPDHDPLIVHVSPALVPPEEAVEALERKNVCDVAQLGEEGRTILARLARSYWPGPLTLVLPKHRRIPGVVTSGLPTVAVRVPAHPVAQALIDAAGAPLAAPSANRFGRISPTSAADVAEELGDRLALCVDGGPCEVGIESTVVALSVQGRLQMLRPGCITAAAIEDITGTRPEPAPRTATPSAPGMLESHYRPAKPLLLLNRFLSAERAPDLPDPLPEILGVLVLRGDPEVAASALRARTGREVVARRWTASGQASEAAHELFAALRALDNSPAQLLLVEPCPEENGVWAAIADRLRRASG